MTEVMWQTSNVVAKKLGKDSYNGKKKCNWSACQREDKERFRK